MNKFYVILSATPSWHIPYVLVCVRWIHTNAYLWVFSGLRSGSFALADVILVWTATSLLPLLLRICLSIGEWDLPSIESLIHYTISSSFIYLSVHYQTISISSTSIFYPSLRLVNTLSFIFSLQVKHVRETLYSTLILQVGCHFVIQNAFHYKPFLQASLNLFWFSLDIFNLLCVLTYSYVYDD